MAEGGRAADQPGRRPLRPRGGGRRATWTGWRPAPSRSSRGGSSFTADTLAELGRRTPGAEFFTILGEDAAARLTTWERHEEVAARSSLVVVDRPGWQEPLPDGFGWVRVEVPHLEVSSTDLRARVLDGRPLDYLLPAPVIAGIRARNLYGAPV